MQIRKVIRLLLLFMLLCNTFVTLNISLAIVSMVKSQDTSSEGQSTIICPNTTFLQQTYSGADFNGTSPAKISSQNTGYDWSETEQNTVLSGYYRLNYISIMLGGFLAHKYGSKKVVGFAQVISSAMSSLIPMAADYGPSAVTWIRAVQGILSFMSVPAGMYSIMGNWSPPDERARFGASFALGSYIGLTIGNFLFGFIGQYLHWTYIFHLTSLLGIIWGVLWYFLVTDTPARHPSITIEEQKYIENSLKEITSRAKTRIPWKDIFTSLPLMISIFAVHSATWTWVAITTYFPIYLKSFYGLNSNEIGILTSTPNIAKIVLTVGIAYGSDMAIRKNLLSMTGVRKISALFGIISAIPLIIIAFTKCNLLLIISCLVLNFIIGTPAMLGAPLVVMDLSPKFCGILEGISGTSSSLLTFAFSALVNYLTTVYDTESLWKTVFLYTAIYGVLASSIFIFFGSAEVQSWNFEDNSELQCKKEDEVEVANDPGKTAVEMNNHNNEEISRY